MKSARLRCALALIIICALAAIYQWWQIYHRYDLFRNHYNSKPGISHVADGWFRSNYRINGALLLAALVAHFLVWPKGWAPRLAVLSVLMLNLTACVMIYCMHRSGVLVTYGEWAANVGP